MSREDKLAAAAADNTAVDTGVKGTVDGSVAAEGNEQQTAPVVKEGDKVTPAPVAETPAPAPAPAPVAEPAAVVAPAVGKVRETTEVQAAAPQSAPRQGSPVALTIIAQWDSYIQDAASNKAQTARSATALRDRLINLLTTTVNLAENKDYVQVSNYLLKEIVSNKTGSFTLSMVHRGFSELPGTTANKPRFALDAYLCFADPATRSAHIGPYNLQNAAQLARTPELRDRFVAYFNRISGNR